MSSYSHQEESAPLALMSLFAVEHFGVRLLKIAHSEIQS
jgi:hypothetical protein